MKSVTQKKKEARARRHRRIRSHLSGTSELPRISVFKSNRAIVAQLIDDETGKTLLSVTAVPEKGTRNKTQAAREAGKTFAKSAIGKGFTRAAFDRGGFRYTGRIASFADGVREGGLTV